MTSTSDGPTNSYSGRLESPEGDDYVQLGELIVNFWEARYLILGTTLVALLLGSYYVWRKSPIYQVDALLQVEDKKAGKGGAAMAALEGIFEQTTKAQAEIEIIKSNLVLGRAIQALSLDLLALPDFNRFIGNARVRGRPDAPELTMEHFEVPHSLRGIPFRIVAKGQGTFRWEGPDGVIIGSGKVGEALKGAWKGQEMSLQVRAITGESGQRFHLVRQHLQEALRSLRTDLKVAERGRQTNILSITFEHRDPVRGAEILNEIVNQYVKQNIQRKAEEASQTLAFLQEQMPQLRAKLDIAEDQLNRFRMKSGSVDLPEEVKLLLQQSVSLESQALSLKQKKDELLRTYQEGADVVVTLNQQIAKLQKESSQIEGRVRGLPHTQQEVVRLHRDVQVNNELYTALLNNVQQLRVAKAGEIGTARIVDYAMPGLRPIKPRRSLVMGLAALLGVVCGIGLSVLRRALNQDVEDPRLIESRLGLPVVVTIPHSDIQEKEYSLQGAKKGNGAHIIAKDHPEDLAVESLRSLRTSLSFTMMDAHNKVVMISGPSPGIGKSFVSSNFAALVAQSATHTRVLLVDGDMRRGNLHQYFGLKHRKSGLSEVLSGQKGWREAIHATDIEGLDLLTSGTLPPNPSELLMSGRFVDFIQEVSDEYNLIIVDAPPVLAVTDPVIIGRQAGSILLLVKSKAHPMDEIRNALSRFENAGIKVKGCIFNDVLAVSLGYKYFRYAYHYEYKK